MQGSACAIVTEPATGSVLPAFRLHRYDFYIVMRKLVSKQEALSQGIQETSMVRFDSAIDANDEVFVRQASGHSGIHEVSPCLPREASDTDRCSAGTR
jgi:hypothetical protein